MLYIAYAPIYCHPLPEGHRFPMQKYELIPEQLLYEGSIVADNLFAPAAIAADLVIGTHTENYWNKLLTNDLDAQHIRRIGFPLTPQLIERERIISTGTIDCARYALQYGVAMNVAGGTHHAFADRGEGFCLLNDIAIAANYLLNNGLSKQIVVIDLDVHQGNGTAAIFRDEPRVYTFSMHGERNFPFHKEQSDWDIGLPDGITDAPYLALLTDALNKIMDTVQPDFVFYLSGVDVLSTDKLGKLGLSRAACKTRDKLVFEQCKRHKIPVSVSMGGGYSERLVDIVEAHANTFRVAQELYF